MPIGLTLEALPSVFASSLEPTGPPARAAADLWWLMTGLGSVVFVVVMGLLVVGLRKRGRSAPREKWLIIGTASSVVLIGVVFWATLVAMRSVGMEAPPGTLVIDVTGHQWWWEVHYPEQEVTTANELHLPVDRDVALRLTSSDVIHSFWVPSLAGKMDLLPDRVNTLVLRADTAATHASLCAEFCGLQHYQMGLEVVAEDAADFSAWIDGQQAVAATPDTKEARRGLELFVTSECANCHTIRGTAALGSGGPDLTHLSSRSELGAGAVPNTEPDLEGWITDPHTVKEGVDMPAADLAADEIDALVAFLADLE